MTSTLRLVVAALALVAAGCGSNNSGKIVGRWKAESGEIGPIGPHGPAEVVWEFGEDGTFTVSRVVPGRPGPNAETVASGRYTLGLRDNVSFTSLNPPLDGKTRAAEKIAIDGDTMTVGGTGKDKTYRFTRLPLQ